MSRLEASLSSAGYGALRVLGPVQVAVESGQLLVVLGPNGAGKSTALRAILGMVTSQGRRLTLNGTDLSALPAWRLPSHGVCLVPDGARTFPNLTVLDNLRGAYLAVAGRRTIPPEHALLDQVFSFFPVLAARRSTVSGTFSGGQRQMLALMAAPRALLLDEPSAGLAPRIVEELFETLGAIKRSSGCAIVMAEQNVGLATQVADQCIVLEEGEVALTGPMAEIVQHERLRTAYLGL
jgi:branched-chain amino acid transport system ATP-binding protein